VTNCDPVLVAFYDIRARLFSK